MNDDKLKLLSKDALSEAPRGKPRCNLLRRSSFGYAGRVSGAAKRNYAVANNPASPRLL